jgi:hypothetical protein
MTTLNENFHAGSFMLSGNFDGSQLSVDAITVKSGQAAIQAGTVLGAVQAGSATETHAGNTGTGAMGAITVGDSAKPGVYTVTFTKAASNAGDFEVVDPTGHVVGVGTVAVAFAGGGLSFTIADATDFIVGDKFLITVTISSTKYLQYNPAGTDGSEVASAILWDYCDASAADAHAAGVVRFAEVKAGHLIWPSTTAAQKAAAIASLARQGIIVR